MSFNRKGAHLRWWRRTYRPTDRRLNEPARQDDTYEEIVMTPQSPPHDTDNPPPLSNSNSSSGSSSTDHIASSPSTFHHTRSILQQQQQPTIQLRRIHNDARRVFVNLPHPKYELDKKGNPQTTFVSNKVRTSKYTIWSFIPKNLFEQFRRAANMYFLGLAILQLVPYFGVNSPVLTLLPIAFVVVITALKDGFEDYQRHKVDARYNSTITYTLIGYKNTNYPTHPADSFFSFRKKPAQFQQHVAADASTTAIEEEKRGIFGRSLSMNVRVGDFILLRNGQSCPADAVLLSSSDPAGICFVETKDLDGETNLKPRQGIADLCHVQSGTECLDDVHMYIEAGKPTPDLYAFEGTLAIFDNDPNGSYVERKKAPIGIDNLILRGHVVRNTHWAIAVVLYTGSESKIIQNSGITPSKRSRIEKQMNQEVIIAFVVLFILCLVCAILAGVKKAQDDVSGGTDLYSREYSSPPLYGFTNFWSSLIIFQNIIPISLYVSIEFVKTFQAYFLWSDLDMYDEASNTACIPKSWNLSDELGQVEYLFSDKTGTLTRNVMEFRECSIAGKRYGNNGFSPESEGARGAQLRREKDDHKEQGRSTLVGDDQDERQRQPTQEQQRQLPLEDPQASLLVNDEGTIQNDGEDFELRRAAIFEDYRRAVYNVFKPRYSSLNPDRLPFADPRIFWDMGHKMSPTTTQASEHSTATSTTRYPSGGEHSDQVSEFLTLLSLCHTVVVDKIDKEGRVIPEVDPDQDPEEDRSVPEVTEQKAPGKPKSGKNQLREAIREQHRKLKKNLKLSRKASTRSNRGEEFDSLVNVSRPEIVDSTVESQLVYKAESPDEAALVSAARDLGFAFLGRQGNQIRIDILGTEYEFTLLNMLEFNSTRKRMSVIVRRPAPWNDIVLYCKGADNVIFERLADNNNKDLLQMTHRDVDAFSNDGLRTLVLGYAILSEDEYTSWNRKMEVASTAAENRADKVEAVQDAIERNLILLGATGIEDKLQEGVPQCIEDLRRAGIKVWVLTGDKIETAINIGYASNLLDSSMTLWSLRSSDCIQADLADIEKQIQAAMVKAPGSGGAQHALIIEGAALNQLFETPELKKSLLDVSLMCKSVMCCRVSPLQKALVVAMVRQGKKAVTLAVGDGANDVSMIQAANIGVGIAGQEGVQASMASDYAIAQFRFLQKLILVQGHWNYHRISEMILNFFYKNVLWVFPSLWYQIYSQFSGNIFYDYAFMQLYNVIFTVAPVVVLGASDQDVTAPYLKRFPQVYEVGADHRLYTRTRYWFYFGDAVWQSLVLFYAFFFAFDDVNPNANGYPSSMLQFSSAVALSAVLIANLMPGFNTYYWTWFQFFFIALELLVTFLWVIIYGQFKSVTIYGVWQMVFGGWNFWLLLLMSTVVSFLPRYVITFTKQWWYPDVMATARHIEKYEKTQARKKRISDNTGLSSWLRWSC